jgi:hypothetical protein
MSKWRDNNGCGEVAKKDMPFFFFFLHMVDDMTNFGLFICQLKISMF